MFSHVMLGSNDIERSKKFYDATFAAFGGNPGMVDPKGRLIYAHGGSMFLLTPPINGEPACPANGGTIGFAMTPDQADAWHAAGCANGGTACEDPPGPREGSPFYLAYLRDPDGNKLCALHVIGS
ncbi:MAG: VOC family protein [Novosphingobium sp.]|uniref:VOC family protein n=1 Tax=Novosphingobium sp. TaxID=1874826 RepID=UPI0030166857